MDPNPLALGMPPEEAVYFTVIKKNVKIAQVLCACGFTICLWDTLACWQTEYRLIWRAKWSSLKVTFLLTRYMTLLAGILFFVGFFGDFTIDTCGRYVKVMPAIGSLVLSSITALLGSRAYTMWDRSTTMAVVLAAFGLAQQAGTLAVALTQTTAAPIFATQAACIPASEGKGYVLYWIFPALSHTVITILTVIRSWELVQAKHSGYSGGERLSALLVTRYGQLFPIGIIAIEVFQIIFYLAADEMLRAICSPFCGFLVAFLACQMVLCLHMTSKSRSGVLNSVSHGSINTHATKHILDPVPSKFTGVRAFVTSHRAVDVGDEEFERMRRSEAYVRQPNLAFGGTAMGRTTIVELPALAKGAGDVHSGIKNDRLVGKSSESDEKRRYGMI